MSGILGAPKRCVWTLILVNWVVGVPVLGCSGASSAENDESQVDDEPKKSSDDDDGRGKGMGGSDSERVDELESYSFPKLSDSPLCRISADCPMGSHCDLGECVQECNEEEACEGDLRCSARARCLADGEEDVDPAPITEKVGDLRLEPSVTVLTEADERLRLRISSSSSQPVRYRVVTTAPHLTVSEPRGEFIEDGIIELEVDSSNLQGTQVPGTVRVITELGETTVDTPMRAGVTGAYEGAFRYQAGDIPMGQARMRLDLQEENGDVRVRIYHAQSLLFPSAEGKDTYGRGIFTVSDGLEFSVKHVLSAQAGEARNWFGRPIGRELKVRVQSKGNGVFEGTFEEKIHGLFVQPVEFQGSVYLQTRAKEVEDFEVVEDLKMPTVDNLPLNTDHLGSRTGARWVVGRAADSACQSLASTPIDPLPRLDDWLQCIDQADEFHFAPLVESLSGVRGDAEPLANLRSACERELALTDAEFVSLGTLRQCANPRGPIAALYELEKYYSPSTETPAKLFHRSLARLLSAQLFVAQDDLVQGVRESFSLGNGNQIKRFERARRRLADVGTVVMQPALLEFLKRTSFQSARGEAQDADRSRVDFPGIRALSRLLFVSSVIDGELAAISASDVTRPREQLLQEAQENAVLTLLEAAVIAGIVDTWGAAPPGAGTELTGALTPMDSGFATLLQGATLFGVPVGEIPLSFDVKSAFSTNFEQALDSRAKVWLDIHASDEASFTENRRSFEQNQAQLEAELESVRAGYDATIAELCGDAFDPELLQTEEDWLLCGADGTGSVAEARIALELRHAEALSAQTRLEGMGEKIKIDEDALADTQAARGKTMNFIDSTNSEIRASEQFDVILRAAVKALELASNASVGNGGASIGMGVAAGVLEVKRSTLENRRNELRRAQHMRQLEESSEIEYINGMAALKKQVVDATQLEIDLEQTTIAIVQAQISILNHLERAKRAVSERERALARISNSPYSDPLYRLLLSKTALQALQSRRVAQRWLYKAGRALEYEINTPLGDGLSRAILAAYNHEEMLRLENCMKGIHQTYKEQIGEPQEFSTKVSVREMLGVTGARLDDVTGETLSEGELFRRMLLRNENLDDFGGVSVEFSTNLEPGNQLWSSNVCGDKVTTIRAQVVGDFQGDNEAEVHMMMAGGGIVRRCSEDALVNWSIEDEKKAVLQAGVNSFGEARANSLLYGQSVARPRWKVTIPGAETAPSNRDLDLNSIEDIVLEIKHEALPGSNFSANIDVSCLSSIGAGN